jgi:hypothetical protein
MPKERFFIDTPFIETETVSLEGTEFHHFAHVMKMKKGDEVDLVNGKGALSKAVVISVDRQRASLKIISTSLTPLSSPRFILAVPLMRPSKLEWVLEKGTELGADAFWLYQAEGSTKASMRSSLTRLTFSLGTQERLRFSKKSMKQAPLSSSQDPREAFLKKSSRSFLKKQKACAFTKTFFAQRRRRSQRSPS